MIPLAVCDRQGPTEEPGESFDETVEDAENALGETKDPN